jgi:hypothetical protein
LSPGNHPNSFTASGNCTFASTAFEAGDGRLWVGLDVGRVVLLHEVRDEELHRLAARVPDVRELRGGLGFPQLRQRRRPTVVRSSVMLEERVGVQPPDLSLDLFHGLALLRLHPLVVLAAVPVTSNFSSPRDV